jgi:hypothetical protein
MTGEREERIVPLPAVEGDDDEVAVGPPAPETPKESSEDDPTRFIDHLRSVPALVKRHPYEAAAIVGMVAAGTAAAAIAARRGKLPIPGSKGAGFTISRDLRHSPDTVSVVSDGEAYLAAAFPVDEKALGRLKRGGRDLFAMWRNSSSHQYEFAHPLADRGREDYKKATERVASWLLHALSSKDSKGEES